MCEADGGVPADPSQLSAMCLHRLELEGADAQMPVEGVEGVDEAAAYIFLHAATNAEVRALAADLQVLGRSEFKQLLKWWAPNSSCHGASFAQRSTDLMLPGWLPLDLKCAERTQVGDPVGMCTTAASQPQIHGQTAGGSR